MNLLEMFSGTGSDPDHCVKGIVGRFGMGNIFKHHRDYPVVDGKHFLDQVPKHREVSDKVP